MHCYANCECSRSRQSRAAPHARASGVQASSRRGDSRRRLRRRQPRERKAPAAPCAPHAAGAGRLAAHRSLHRSARPAEGAGRERGRCGQRQLGAGGTNVLPAGLQPRPGSSPHRQSPAVLRLQLEQPVQQRRPGRAAPHSIHRGCLLQVLGLMSRAGAQSARAARHAVANESRCADWSPPQPSPGPLLAHPGNRSSPASMRFEDSDEEEAPQAPPSRQPPPGLRNEDLPALFW